MVRVKLKDKVCIVTGGAMGNGLGIVKVFLKYGAKVVILDYAESLNDVVEGLKAEGHEVSGYRVDVRNRGAINTAIKSVVKQYENIDVLVNGFPLTFSIFIDIFFMFWAAQISHV